MKIFTRSVTFSVRTTQIVRTMKISVFLLLVSIFPVIANNAYSQDVEIAFNKKNTTLESVIQTIESSSSYRFLYRTEQIDMQQLVKVSVVKTPVIEILNDLSKSNKFNYKILENNLIVLSPNAIAAKFKVTGTIVSAKTLETLIGVTVNEKGTKNTTVTDANGAFTIMVSSPNAFLEISYIGYESQEVEINNTSQVTIRLVESVKTLDEVVVVGYGSQKRKDVVGSVATVGSKDIKNLSVTTVDQALLGAVAGVQVKPVSGQPGVAPQIRVRGIGSISAGSGPLYIVDGFPVADIQTLNPNDIETMDILKDASATAIYGSRGSNGLIIITTKIGKTGKANITYDTYFGIQQVSLKPVMKNAMEEAQYFYDGVKNRNLDAGNNVTGLPATWKLAVPQDILDVLSGKNTTDINWLDLVLRKAPEQSHQLSVTGGNESVKYALSGEYLDQQGIIRNTDFKRYSLRANIDAQVSKRLIVKINLNPSFTDENIVQASGVTSGANENVIGSAMAVTPYYPVYDASGNYYVYNALSASGNFYHPLALVNEIQHPRNGSRLLGNINAEYKITENLKFNILMGVDLRSIHESKFKPQIPAFLNDPAYGSDLSTMDKNWLTEYTLNYIKSFNKHNLTGLVGYTVQKDRFNSGYLYSNKFPNNLVPTLSAVSGLITDGTSTIEEWSMVSYLARVNYNFDSKYYVTASIRTDGSSRFGDNRKYGIFPSVGLAWRILDEKFLKNVSFLSDMKLRASYGESGNNNIGNYAHMATAIYEKYILGGTAIGGYAPGGFDNPDLTWEKQQQLNAGVNVGFFKSRLNINVDYFRSTNTDLLLNVNTPAITGFNSALQNIGRVRNTGWEFAVNSVNLNGKFIWSTDFNISAYKNKVVKLGPSGDPIISGGNITEIGQPIGIFYGWLTNGIFKNQAELDKGPIYGKGTASGSHIGDIRFVDVSGPNGKPDGIIDSFDKTIMGTPYPNFYYGMTNRFSYNNLSLIVSLQGSHGAQTMSPSFPQANLSCRARTNQLALSNNYWKSPEQPGDGNTPRPNDAPTGNVRGESSQYELQDASYLRINNITMSYLLPDKISGKLKLTAVRVYVSASNPFIFTKYKSFNPESSNSANSLNPGIDLNDYPVPKSLSVGLNVTF